MLATEAKPVALFRIYNPEVSFLPTTVVWILNHLCLLLNFVPQGSMNSSHCNITVFSSTVRLTLLVSLVVFKFAQYCAVMFQGLHSTRMCRRNDCISYQYMEFTG
jgi:hypothetical protein